MYPRMVFACATYPLYEEMRLLIDTADTEAVTLLDARGVV